MRLLRVFALLPLFALLAGCDFVVLSPTGDIAARQRDLLVISTLLMLVIIIPVMALTIFFAWKYRASNKVANYDPEWSHSTQLELVIWSAPLLIIICLGALTWMGTHLLDPYRPLDRIAEGQPVEESVEPLDVQVVALDWKWLFIYPEQGVASVNELIAPVDRPIRFSISSSSVMNAFYVPTLAGMIYAMPGMRTELHAVANAPVESRGFSANFSGAGFSGMYFAFRAVPTGDFDAWVESARGATDQLTRASYLELERPSENVPVRHFSSVEANMFDYIVNMCVDPGKMCMTEMMAIDAKGGLGLDGITNTLPLTYDKHARRGTIFGGQPGYVVGICTPEELLKSFELAVVAEPRRDMTPLRGAGLSPPALLLGKPAHSGTPADTVLTGLRRLSNS